MNIGSVSFGPGQPCRFIAEMSNNHNGSITTAIRLIVEAKKAGADLVKFQAFTLNELIALRGNGPAPEPWGSQGWSMAKLYARAATPFDWFPVLIRHCEDMGIQWFSSVFGPESLAMLEGLGCPAYKLASLDCGVVALMDMVKTTGKLMLRSVPEPGLVIGSGAVLYCPPGYPQKSADIAALFKEAVYPMLGYSYHGTNPLIPAFAAGVGAMLVEVHLQLDEEPSELESNVSLTASQFRQMVDMARTMEAAL